MANSTAIGRRNGVCEDCGERFSFSGIRRVKRCPDCKAARRRMQDRDRKAGYRRCWQCGNSRPLTFDRDGPVEDDFGVPAAFCGLTCWMLWWDAYALEELRRWYMEGQAGNPPLVIPPAYLRIRDHAEAGGQVPDYRGDPAPGKGGDADRNEILSGLAPGESS